MKYQERVSSLFSFFLFFNISKERMSTQILAKCVFFLSFLNFESVQSFLWHHLSAMNNAQDYTFTIKSSASTFFPSVCRTALHCFHNKILKHSHSPLHTGFWSLRTWGFFNQSFDWILCHPQHSHKRKYTPVVDRECLEQHHLPLRPLPEDRAIPNASQIVW